jgi:hypothetical protein
MPWYGWKKNCLDYTPEALEALEKAINTTWKEARQTANRNRSPPYIDWSVEITARKYDDRDVVKDLAENHGTDPGVVADLDVLDDYGLL